VVTRAATTIDPISWAAKVPSPPVMSSSRHPPLLLLFTLQLGGLLSINLYAPSMPDIAHSLAATPASVQLTITVFLIGFSLAQLIYGPLSDRYGRRPVLFVGLAIYLAANLASMLAPTIDALLAFRVVQGVGACAGGVLLRAIVRDLYERDQAVRVMGLLAIAAGLTTTLAPALGGFLATFGWRMNFAFLALVSLIPYMVAWFWLPETNKYRGTQAFDLGAVLRNYGILLRSPSFMGYTLIVASVNAWFFAFIAASPFLLIDRLDQPQWAYGFYILVHTGSYWLGAAFASRFGTRIGIDRMIGIGVAATTAGFAVMWGLAVAGEFTVAAIIAPMLITGFTSGLCFPPGQASAVSAYPSIAGTASGLLGLFQMGFGALTSYLASLFVHHDQVAITSMMLLLSTLALPAYALVKFDQRRRRSAS